MVMVELTQGEVYRLLDQDRTYDGRCPAGHHRFVDSYGGLLELNDDQVDQYLRDQQDVRAPLCGEATQAHYLGTERPLNGPFLGFESQARSDEE